MKEKEKTVLETWHEAQRKEEEELQKFDAEMSAKRVASDNELIHITGELEKERGILDRLKAEYASIELTIEAAAQAAVEATAITREKVSRGEASLEDLMASGAREKEAAARARADAAPKLGDCLRLIREKQTRVFELEAAAADHRFNSAYLLIACPKLKYERMKEGFKTLEKSMNNLTVAYINAEHAFCEAEKNYALAVGKSFQNQVWETPFDLAGLKELRFDPRFPEKYFPDLDLAIAEVEGRPGLRFSISLKVPASGDPGLILREVEERGRVLS